MQSYCDSIIKSHTLTTTITIFFRNIRNYSHADDACVVAVHLAHPLALLPLLHRLVRGLDLQGRLLSGVGILKSANHGNEGKKLSDFEKLKSSINSQAKNQRFSLCNVNE